MVIGTLLKGLLISAVLCTYICTYAPVYTYVFVCMYVQLAVCDKTHMLSIQCDPGHRPQYSVGLGWDSSASCFRQLAISLPKMQSSPGTPSSVTSCRIPSWV